MAQMYNITYNVPAIKCPCYLSKFDFVEYLMCCANPGLIGSRQV